MAREERGGEKKKIAKIVKNKNKNEAVKPGTVLILMQVSSQM